MASQSNIEEAWNTTTSRLIHKFRQTQQKRKTPSNQSKNSDQPATNDTEVTFSQDKADKEILNFRHTLNLLKTDVLSSGNFMLNLIIGLIHKNLHHFMAQLTYRNKSIGYKLAAPRAMLR